MTAGTDGLYSTPPAQVIVCDTTGLSPAERMLLESLSGLAALAVNRKEFDEMVWIGTDNPSYRQIFRHTLAALSPSAVKEMDVWQLLAYLKSRKVVKGYVLYRADPSAGPLYSRRQGMDLSANVATVYASLLHGVLVEESLEKQIASTGLRRLKDARRETPAACFEKNRHLLNNRSALSIDPRVIQCRDIAIAQQLMVYYNTDPLSERILEWVKPLSPILGWNCGDEDEYTGAISRWGHYNTATNWCCNLPLIMAASDRTEPAALEEPDTVKPDSDPSLSYHAFLMSDGDNMQWTMGSFLDTPLYFANPDNHRTPISWTLCPVNLSVVSTSTWNRMVQLKSPHSSFVEYGGGYQYPDEFASRRPNRAELLTEFARRMDWHFRRLNLKVFGFICKDVFSPQAREAYEIYAREITGLTGMVAIQYAPYNAGGTVLWVDNGQGEEIPVATARYAIWADLFDLSTRGAPDYIASQINREAAEAATRDRVSLEWTVVHAWSDFGRTTVSPYRPQKGYNTVRHADRLLSPLVKNVSLEELLWRIRKERISRSTDTGAIHHP
ncbi:MAG: hypothetical protein LUF04_10265 [Bacteroides sp.]|nr:hypothetical protein [Bacteroides sp.]